MGFSKGLLPSETNIVAKRQSNKYSLGIYNNFFLIKRFLLFNFFLLFYFIQHTFIEGQLFIEAFYAREI